MESIRFETAENIEVSYQPAGLGTRFVGWFVDYILMTLLAFFMLVALICTGAIVETTLQEPLRKWAENMQSPEQAQQFSLYFIGAAMIVWGLGGFFYYGLSELFLRGQTLGKKSVGIRVVKVDGFSLDAPSILVRNIFRVVDHLPPLWIVPVLSTRSQRLGDMVAGTVVIADKPEKLYSLREVLSSRSAAESRFRFDAGQLKLLGRRDFEAIERILERGTSLSAAEREPLLNQVVVTLAKRLKVDEPAADDRLAFVEDLLAAEYRRQNRELG